MAHVDAGKTTLAEAMLYLAGKIKKLGRVDHRDSYLDTHWLERERGITIFSKQAVFDAGGVRFSLLDTPGHADFSAETERTLQVLDCAVLVISGTDGVQAHTETLWRLLRRYGVPVFVFVTKMDLGVCDKAALMSALTARLGPCCVDFTADTARRDEEVALSSERAMDIFGASGGFADDDIASLVSARLLVPCFFGSGLRLDGVERLLDALERYASPAPAGTGFGARVYKIARDAQGQRMTFMKLTGGELAVRSLCRYEDEDGAPHEEKITQIRIYSGAKYETAECVRAGQVCAVLGLSASFPGQGLGAQAGGSAAVVEPVMSYSVLLPPGADARVVFPKLLLLQEEDPQLHIVWNERARGISVQLMGKVQAEVFKSLVSERFGVDVALDAGHIMYRVLERPHPGVLTGSPLTDVKITLAAGRAHLKHTEGGDFRQATYRAIRQGLMQAESVLLEPYYAFTLEAPPEQIGRAISDLRAMGAEFSSPEDAEGLLRVRGAAPVAAMNGYMAELTGYTHGRGRLALRLDSYRPCRNARAVIDAIGYDPLADTENTPDSVFCAHGAGFNVSWDKVKDYMHLDSCLRDKSAPPPPAAPRRSMSIDERELEAIMEREFGPIKRPEYRAPAVNAAPAVAALSGGMKQYVIVDGYNLIFAWDELKKLAADNMDLARARLMDILSSYSGFTRAELVLVFDAYRTPGNKGSRGEYHNIHVAYTADGETADMYIERLANDIGRNYAVRVVTSDNLIRLSALRSGVLRASSKEFAAELEWTLGQIDAILKKTNQDAHKTRVKDGKG